MKKPIGRAPGIGLLVTALAAFASDADAQANNEGCDVVALSAGSRHSLALRGDGSVWAWGANTFGQLGDDTRTDRDEPVQVVYPGGQSLTGFVSVAAGGWHSLALRSDGTVWVWGSNAFYQLGQSLPDPAPGEPAPGYSTTAVQLVDGTGSPVLGIRAIAAGSHHSLAVRHDGTLLAWGASDAGQLGDGTTAVRIAPVTVIDLASSPLTHIKAVAAGHAHSLALRSDGTVWTWGYNQNGQLATGVFDKGRSSAGQVVGLDGIKAIAAGAGGNHSLALKGDGTVYAWGWNEDGQLGNSSAPVNSATPVQVVGPSPQPTLTEVKAISAGGHHSLALTSAGTVLAWGRNTQGQLGNPTNLVTNDEPVQVLDGPGPMGFPLDRVVAIAAGGFHSSASRLAVKVLIGQVKVPKGGQVRSWGLDDRGQLGDQIRTISRTNNTTVVVTALACGDCAPAFIDMDGGTNHSVGLKGDGGLRAWGSDVSGELGDGAFSSGSASPVEVNLDLPAVDLASGSLHNLAVDAQGMVWAWGANALGQLGIQTLNMPRFEPVQVVDLLGQPFPDAIAVAAGDAHSLALKSNGEVWAWGDDGSGQLGNGPGVPADGEHVQVNLPPTVRAIAIAAGHRHSLALTDGGRVYAWGENFDGQLGNGSGPTDSDVPVLVLNLSDTVEVAGGGDHSLALIADGSASAWGDNEFGQLGDSTTLDQSTPVSISFAPGTGVRAISGGGIHSLAVVVDGDDLGSAWAWGANADGQLGNPGAGLQSPDPVRVGPTAPADRFTGVAGAGRHSLARFGDGLLQGFGDNMSGQLGDGTINDAPEPVDSARDVLPGAEGNILTAVKVLDLVSPFRSEVRLEFPGATAFTGRWGIFWDFEKDMADLPTQRKSPILQTTTWIDLDAVENQPIFLLYQVRGLSAVCANPGP